MYWRSNFHNQDCDQGCDFLNAAPSKPSEGINDRIYDLLTVGRIKERFALFLSLIADFRKKYGKTLLIRFDKSEIASVDMLLNFTQTRSSYVAQTSLYGYLKTRMGIRYPKAFEDKEMSASISLARWRVYCACVSDFSIFSAATIADVAGLGKADTKKLALHCFKNVIERTFGDSEYAYLAGEVEAAFKARIKQVAWDQMAIMENAFKLSPEDLVKYAPVIDDYRERDREIVMNSIRYRWRDVREQFRKRVDASAIVADWKSQR